MSPPCVHAGIYARRVALPSPGWQTSSLVEGPAVTSRAAIGFCACPDRISASSGLAVRCSAIRAAVGYHPRMRILGTTARRIVYAILLTALIPVVSSLLISRAIIARVSATAFQPEFGAQLDRSLAVY